MRPLLIFLGLAMPLISLAQHPNADSLFFAEMPLREVTYTDKGHQVNITLPFKEIHIWDARPDTASIGFIGFRNIEKPYRVVFKDELSGEVTRFVAANYLLNHEDTAHNLIVLVKKFRISDYISAGEVQANNVQQWNSGIIFEAELFLQIHDTYHALYKLDTLVFAETESVDDLIENSFKALFKKSENKELTQMHIGKTAFSFSDLNNHAGEFTNIPILKDHVLKKGIYKTFNEFKTNSPSILNFRVISSLLTDDVFITENNSEYLIQDFWGLCDGKNLYVRSANKNFHLTKAGNTFNTRAFKSLTKRGKLIKDPTAEMLTNLAIFGTPSYTTTNNRKYRAKSTAFQLDMETGEIY